jgi:geranylgeranyl diphosphate synthase, type I
MALQELSELMLAALETELRRQVGRVDQPISKSFHDILAYHMGWSGDQGGGTAAGKRIRPLVTLLVVEGCGEKWLHALSAAAAVEIIHNFSLVHDDIEDNSPTRRGRTTIWKKYGVPMAINAGDALFSISNQAMLDSAAYYPADTVLQAAACLHDACLALTCGQFLDMSFEKRIDISVEDYWPMIGGKTAALLSAAARIGAILGGADGAALQSYTDFARYLGLAFQVQDDMLGIWGDEATTGKSAASDLAEGKNSLPVLYGLRQSKQFAERWAQARIKAEETPALAQILKDAGAYSYCSEEAKRLTALSLESLASAAPKGQAGIALRQLIDSLLKRKS